ncbi:helix-turn-helix transcriptional regulator [Streptomyces coacervatus]|uniref:helix-turn-helix domain-containing protein n=1 Tax=Streptomyces coacervatus TaxID=647381 RepID=UPI0023DCC0A6|nr:helix-turn-helix transcriptional regulator [Streptomyces coacervatus]MDF2269307.1 helix-turn-helix transcriptional regulator [Streptomyces coacervatus]
MPSLPEHVWQNPAVTAALADWDFGTAFRLIRQAASLRQEDMSVITGLSQSFLSTLESGTRRLLNIDKIIPVLERLGVPPHVAPIPVPGSAAQNRPQTSGTQPTLLPTPGWESPLDIAKRLNATTSSNTDPATVAVLEQGVTDLVDRYETEGPHRLAPEAVDLRNFIQGRLDGRQPPRQRESLFRLAAQASGLLGYMAVNAGREAVAEAYCKEAEELAKGIADLELIMWIQGTRSLNAYYAGHYDQAVRWADAGLEIDPDHPQAIRLESNGRARALGKLGDRSGAERAIAAAEELSSRHLVPVGLTSCISFKPYGMARTLANAATVHVSLANAPRVLAYADAIDELVEQSDSAWSQALVRLDVATALLAGPRPDVEHAMVLGRQVLEAGGGPPIRSVVQRAGELHAGARSWQDLPAVREYGDALRSWQAAPQTRDLAKSAKMTRPTEQTRGPADAAHSRPGRISSQPSTQHH